MAIIGNIPYFQTNPYFAVYRIPMEPSAYCQIVSCRTVSVRIWAQFPCFGAFQATCLDRYLCKYIIKYVALLQHITTCCWNSSLCLLKSKHLSVIFLLSFHFTARNPQLTVPGEITIFQGKIALFFASLDPEIGWSENKLPISPVKHHFPVIWP